MSFSIKNIQQLTSDETTFTLKGTLTGDISVGDFVMFGSNSSTFIGVSKLLIHADDSFTFEKQRFDFNSITTIYNTTKVVYDKYIITVDQNTNSSLHSSNVSTIKTTTIGNQIKGIATLSLILSALLPSIICGILTGEFSIALISFILFFLPAYISYLFTAGFGELITSNSHALAELKEIKILLRNSNK